MQNLLGHCGSPRSLKHLQNLKTGFVFEKKDVLKRQTGKNINKSIS